MQTIAHRLICKNFDVGPAQAFSHRIDVPFIVRRLDINAVMRDQWQTVDHAFLEVDGVTDSNSLCILLNEPSRVFKLYFSPGLSLSGQYTIRLVNSGGPINFQHESALSVSMTAYNEI
jgi:hypothetical protein